jgi:hypothetical protein
VRRKGVGGAQLLNGFCVAAFTDRRMEIFSAPVAAQRLRGFRRWLRDPFVVEFLSDENASSVCLSWLRCLRRCFVGSVARVE